jgi:hypothetical protein
MTQDNGFENESKGSQRKNKVYSYIVLLVLIFEITSYIKAYQHLAPSISKLKNIVGGIETLGFIILMLSLTVTLLIVQIYSLLVKNSFLNKLTLWLTVLSLLGFIYSLAQQFGAGCSIGGGC